MEVVETSILALSDFNKPIGISQFEATTLESLATELKGSLKNDILLTKKDTWPGFVQKLSDEHLLQNARNSIALADRGEILPPAFATCERNALFCSKDLNESPVL